jgi:hypothetical protein
MDLKHSPSPSSTLSILCEMDMNGVVYAKDEQGGIDLSLLSSSSFLLYPWITDETKILHSSASVSSSSCSSITNTTTTTNTTTATTPDTPPLLTRTITYFPNHVPFSNSLDDVNFVHGCFGDHPHTIGQRRGRFWVWPANPLIDADALRSDVLIRKDSGIDSNPGTIG